jgi:hypothetical protein
MERSNPLCKDRPKGTFRHYRYGHLYRPEQDPIYHLIVPKSIIDPRYPINREGWVNRIATFLCLQGVE